MRFLSLYLYMMKACGVLSFSFRTFRSECLTGTCGFCGVFFCLVVFCFSVLFYLMVMTKKATQATLEFVKGFITSISISLLVCRTIVGSRYLQLRCCFPLCPSSVLILNVTERGGDIMVICNGIQCYIAPFLWPQQRALAEKNRGWLPPLWAWTNCYGYMTLDLKKKL